MGQVFIPSLDKIIPNTDQYPMPPCTKVDPEIFTAHRSRKQAKRICMGCPFRQSCRIKVMHLEVDPGGVYAALTRDDRDEIRKRVSCQRSS